MSEGSRKIFKFFTLNKQTFIFREENYLEKECKLSLQIILTIQLMFCVYRLLNYY